MFENFVMLAGLGGAVMPLVIHLLSRARYRPVEWGAMMFLQEATPATAHVGRLREWTLLAVRMAAIGLLAVALARPVAGSLTGAAEPGRTAVAIVVDCSGSMSHHEAGGTRMDMAREVALRVLSTLRRGDQVALIPAAGAATAVPTFTGDLQSVATRVNELKTVATPLDLPAALAGAADALARQESSTSAVYLVCDRQRSNFETIDEDVAAQIRKRMADAGARLVVIPVGSDDVTNVAVESVELLDPLAVAGSTLTAEVKVRNYGPTLRAGLPLVIRYRGRDAAVTVNVGGRQSASVSVPLDAGPAGMHVLAAELQSDASDGDDRMEEIVEVVGPIRTLIVRGDDVPAGDVDFASAALGPHRAAKTAGADVANVDVISYTQWAAESLANYQVLVLDDVAALSPKEARAVEQFVYGGGGLLLAPGPGAKIEEYNRLLYREDAGLLPALLQPPAPSAAPMRIEAASLDANHPLTRALAAEPGPLPGVVRQYFPVTARTAGAHVLASFTSGDPFIMDTSFGAGRVALMTCTLDARWSTLPLTSVYLPLMQSSVRHLAGSKGSNRNVSAGEEIVATFSPPVDGSRVVVIRPDGNRDVVEVAQLEQRTEVRYGHTSVAGVYTIRAGAAGAGPENMAQFAVAPTPAESNLEPLTSEKWTAMAQQIGFVREAGELRAAGAEERTAGRGWIMALSAVLVLLVAEMALVRRWSEETE